MFNAVNFFRCLIPSLSDMAPSAPMLLLLLYKKRIIFGVKNKKYYNLIVNAVKLFKYFIPSLSDKTPSAPILLLLFHKKQILGCF